MTAPTTFDLETEVRELFIAKLQEFAAFCADNWQLTEKDMAEIVAPCEHPEAYRQGYNAAMTDGLTGALDHWRDETGYDR